MFRAFLIILLVTSRLLTPTLPNSCPSFRQVTIPQTIVCEHTKCYLCLGRHKKESRHPEKMKISKKNHFL